MPEASEYARRFSADIRRGWSASVEEIVVAALVSLPFLGTLAIFAGHLVDVPAAALIVASGIVQGIATFWLAGYRRNGKEN